MSSKIKTSLMLLLILVVGFISTATPAAAQRRTVSVSATYAPTLTPPTIDQNGFYIEQSADFPPGFVREGVASNGIIATTDSDLGLGFIQAPPGASSDYPTTIQGGPENFVNLEELLRFGGTIELAVKFGSADPASEASGHQFVIDPDDLTLENIRHRFVITEIMWGLDLASTGAEQASKQWIEIYNDHSSAAAEKLITSGHAFVFTENVMEDRIGKPINVVRGQDSGDDFDPDVHEEANKFYVVDRVSLINRFGHRWEPPGGSGRTAVGSNGEPITNLVSMYRKRDLNETRAQYKSDKSFGDGSEADSWAASVGRINMDGPYIGTPGAVQQDYGGQVVSETLPASLPVGTVIINEIFNGIDFFSEDGLQWIELHNTGDTEVDIKNWEMEAAYPFTANLRRVFAIPDRDTKISPGGFLVITNKDPADSILAGGVDLYDTNNDKFPAGANHLYIVIEPGSETAGDNEQPDGSKTNQWMLEEGFMLVLRNGNDRNNHEKIVDIAGNQFITVENDAIVTDVWPLRGWTVPDNRGTAAEQEARWGYSSLELNTGRTYARKEQKSRENRLHKDDWEPNVQFRGGLGYDPNVEHAMAPGTPGYPNNGLKDNPANITGEIVISEIMYDAGPTRNLAQWIELYNSSMTEAAALKDWEFEIRNIDTDVESYVDAKFKFDDDAIILPNQTLLLVSDRSSASDVVENRLYNLYQKHRNDLGLSARKSVLLSSEGFHLTLRDKDGNAVDAAGNVMLDGPRRSVDWALPETGGDVRYSIVRGFGTQAPYDGNRDAANDGMMESSWIIAQSARTHYGHRDDMGSPGDRDGSPVPVSLSSFRPVRDKATGEVVIRWGTESELNNAGFNILRSETKNGEFKVINVKGIIAGHGTTSEKHVYTYTDTTAKPNVVYYYQIEDVSLDGRRTTLATTHLRGNVTAAGKVTATWADLKAAD